MAEVRGSRFDIAMVILHATIIERLELLTCQESHRGTTFDVALLLNGTHGFRNLLHILVGNPFAAGH